MPSFINKLFGVATAKVLGAFQAVGKNLANLFGESPSKPSLRSRLESNIGSRVSGILRQLLKVSDYYANQQDILNQVPFHDEIGDEMALRLPIRQDARGIEPIYSYQVKLTVEWGAEGVERDFHKYVLSPTPMDRGEILSKAEELLWDTFRSASLPVSRGGSADTAVTSAIIQKFRLYGG